MKKYAIIILVSTVGAIWGAEESPSSSPSEDMAFDSSSGSDVDERLASSGISVDPEVIERVTKEKAEQDAEYKKQAAEWERLRKGSRPATKEEIGEHEAALQLKDMAWKRKCDAKWKAATLQDITNESPVKQDKTDQLIQQLKETGLRMMAKAAYYAVPASLATVAIDSDEENDDPWL